MNARGKIRTCAEKRLKLSPFPIGLRERIGNAGGLKGIQTLTKSVQDFYAVRLHHQPENRIGVEGGIHTRTSLVLTKLCIHQKSCASLPLPPLRRGKN